MQNKTLRLLVLSFASAVASLATGIGANAQTSVYTFADILKSTPEECQTSWKNKLTENNFVIYPERDEDKQDLRVVASKKNSPVAAYVRCNAKNGVWSIGISGTNWDEMKETYLRFWQEPSKKK